MPTPILTSTAVVMCAHGGRVIFMPNAKVLLSGVPAAAMSATLPIVGCANPTPPANTGPDLTVLPLPNSASTKVLSNGQPMFMMLIGGTPIPSGVPLLPALNAGQVKVLAS